MSLTPAQSLKLWHIKNCPLFSQLPAEELKAVVDVADVVSCSPGDLVAMSGEDLEAVWVVKRGHIKLTYTDPGGKEAAVLLLGPGDIFGVLPSRTETSVGEHCRALTASCLCRLHRRRFDSLMARYPNISMRITGAIFDRLQSLQLRLADLMMRPAEARLALILLELKSAAGHRLEDGTVELDLAISHSDLAQLIGTSREMVTILLKRFRQDDLVETSRKTIILRNIPALTAIRDGESTPTPNR
jgi:CRP-like cAMP-binding protein